MAKRTQRGCDMQFCDVCQRWQLTLHTWDIKTGKTLENGAFRRVKVGDVEKAVCPTCEACLEKLKIIEPIKQAEPDNK